MSPFIVNHLINGVELSYYLKSTILLFSVYVFCVLMYQWGKTFRFWDIVMRVLVYISLVFTIIALLFYNSEDFASSWWWIRKVTPGVPPVARLKLLTYEASYLSLIMVPIITYFVCSLFIKIDFQKNILPISIIIFLLILSFSFGVIGGLIISILSMVTIILYNKMGWRKLLLIYSILFIGSIILFWILYSKFPDTVLMTRIQNVISGNDSSFRGRTSESFILSNALLNMKDPFWGIGLGQIKVLGVDLWNTFYYRGNHQFFEPFEISTVSIPNSAAETLAIFGYIGFVLRITIQIVLFYSTKVYKNAFKLSLFIFIFIYQFTGSYIVNLAEYVIWILAFLPSFKEFDFVNFKKDYENSLSIKS